MAKLGTKERLLATSRRLLATQGYSGTGLKQVTDEARTPWGSMYHFFPGGKKQLAAEAIYAAAAADNELLEAAFVKSPDARTAIQRIFKAERRRIEASDFTEGCPVGTVALDVPSSAGDVREACAAAFASWGKTISAALAHAGLTDSEARSFATFTLSALEGATMLSRTFKSSLPLRQSATMVDTALAAILERAARA